MRTINVKGDGKLSIHPDTTRITIEMEGQYPDYNETLRHSSEETEQMKNMLMGLGFNRTDLKTLNFTVDTVYESYKYKDTYKRRFAGYKFSHSLKVEFDSDNERLGKVLYAIANSPSKPEFQISYTIKNPDAAKDALLEKAVKDAVKKAKIMARAAGVSLGDVQSIDYRWHDFNFEVRPMRHMCIDYKSAGPAADETRSYDMDVDPDDIEITDTVTVVWEIRQDPHFSNP